MSASPDCHPGPAIVQHEVKLLAQSAGEADVGPELVLGAVLYPLPAGGW